MCDIFNKVTNQAELFPNKVAIIENNGDTLTYRQLMISVNRYTTFLQNKIGKNYEKVAICIYEGKITPIIVLALSFLRHTIIPLNPRLKSNQLKYLLSSVDAKTVIVDSNTINLFKEVEINTIKIDCNFKYKDNTIVRPNKINNYDDFIITLSSGSTGDPKPIVISEQVKMMRFAQAVEIFTVTSDDVILCASPFFHSLGQRLTLLPLMAGATLVQLPNFTTKKWCEMVIEHRVTFTISVSSHLHLVMDNLLKSPNDFNSLRCLVSSSASIDKDVKSKLFKLLGCEFHEMYGATEIATATNLNQVDSLKKPASVGAPCKNVKIRIVNDNFLDKNTMELGKIIIKSPLASSGYYNQPKVTDKFFVSGYFVTGDIGFLDKDGFLYFVDREKDIIISGGENIYPSDIEACINKHSSVDSSIVIGIDDIYFGEVPVAVVVAMVDDHILIEKQLRLFLRSNLASNQQPMKYFFRKSFPLTPSGKIDRRKLQNSINSFGLDLSAKLRQIQKINDK